MKITDADGNIGASVHGESIDPNSYVSMNMWGLTPEFMETLETGFVEFFDRIGKGEADPIKTEYLLPIYIGQLLREGKVSVQLLETKDKWFGVTYKEDKAIVVDSIQKLVEAGVYKKDLFSDLSIVD